MLPATHTESPSAENVSARQRYAQELSIAREKIALLDASSTRYVWIRTAVFAFAVVCLFLGYAGDQYRVFLQSAGWAAVVAFLYALIRSEHIRRETVERRSDVRLFTRMLARLDRDWSGTTLQPLMAEFADSRIADDLDLAGPASLLAFFSLAITPPGRRTVQAWLLKPPTWPEVQQRQKAVRRLRDERDLRLQLIRTILACSDGNENVLGLPTWARSPDWLKARPIARLTSLLGPALILVGLVMLGCYVWSGIAVWGNVAAGIIGAGFLVNILATVIWGSWLHDVFQQVTGQHRAVFGFARVFSSLADLPADEGLLQKIRADAVDGPSSAVRGFAELLTSVKLANLQRDPVLYVVYLALQLTVAWDFRVMERLEKWKSKFGDSTEEWFHSLGTCEALVCGATLADEYRQWAFPEPLKSAGLLLRVESIAHPLLADAANVTNNLQLERARPLLLVTGSNMAGKSTFMRAVGLNLLLARTGSPVCATHMETDLYELASSIRVRDSLRDGVSFFMAELQRLKEVVDAAEQAQRNNESPMFFLLDEILQGTNSRERQIAVDSVVQRLLEYQAVGMLSTHDLDLAAEPSIERVSQIVHFREHFETVDGREEMRFDYKLRAGPTPTTNALKMLNLVGLGR
ncbi:MAG: hypothetical protein KDB22_17035 [Planctomycetales bacterium]|nr:hypothetical protein [Planctomycetales bacterium]